MDEVKDSTKLLVIGGGPGGYAAAFLAADLGMEVALVDTHAEPGGVCLHRGCIPSKSLLHVAKVLNEAKEVRECGVSFAEPQIDLERLRSWKSGVVGKLASGLSYLEKQRKVRHIEGKAKFVSSNRALVDGADGKSREIAFEHAIVATGSYPIALPGLPQSPYVLDSTAALELSSIPTNLLVIGGGYIGLELGSVYASLGSAVTVVEMTDGLLPGADRDLVSVLAKRIGRLFREVKTRTKLLGIEEIKGKAEGENLLVRLQAFDQSVEEKTFSAALVSVGRKPSSQNLGLENTKVRTNARGFIEVDPSMRTADPAIYAIGDVAGEPMLAHKASLQGRVAAEAISGKKSAFDVLAMPAVVFTDPEIAWCGLTESEANAKKIPVKVLRFPWTASGRAASVGRSDGFTKILADPGSERVLGVSIVGAGAGELIAEGTLAIEMGATATDLEWTVHPHPTLSETMMEAASMFLGTSTHAVSR